jgi:catechol 2,3-dioxygenase
MMESSATQSRATRDVSFRPRRLGHVNLWVDNLESSIDFYESVCGIELVRRERALLIGFHSNGNTHHDIGIIEVSRGQDRYGRDGTLQIPRTRGLAPGLNHLGWEMENEAELVAAYKRAQDCGYPLQRAVDHLISHSVYVNDPDGNGHEFYADELQDWRSIYNLDREEEVTGLWDPLAGAPRAKANYNVDPPIRRVDRAPIHPSHLTGVRFATRRFEDMLRFFISVAGLRVVSESKSPLRSVRLAGATGRVDMTLHEAAAGEPIGLRAFRMRLNEALEPKAAAAELTAAGAHATVRNDELLLSDPDGFVIEFHQRDA